MKPESDLRLNHLSLLRPAAGPRSELPKKNLSAFCSDMLDEYLENEGKLIDERAASFSQPVAEPVVYELPVRSTSYVRTLDSILKKQPVSSPTSDLISGFIPPSKRPKLTRKETTTSRREDRKQRGPKPRKLRGEPPGSASEPSPADLNLVPKQPAGPSELTAPHKSKKHLLKVQSDHTELSALSPQPPAFKRRKRLKPKTSSQTLSPPRSAAPPPGLSGDMAPLESDSELGTAVDQSADSYRKDGGPMMTRALLRQKDLEDGVVWDGRLRTSITEERATIALTSLFTLKVRDHSCRYRRRAQSRDRGWRSGDPALNYPAFWTHMDRIWTPQKGDEVQTVAPLMPRPSLMPRPLTVCNDWLEPQHMVGSAHAICTTLV